MLCQCLRSTVSKAYPHVYIRDRISFADALLLQSIGRCLSVQLIPGSDNKYRYNYWGYSTIGFFAPMARYSQAAAQGKHGQDVVKEFKTMVKECHKRGIEVLMDVVFNHTAEGNEKGPTLSFRYNAASMLCCTLLWYTLLICMTHVTVQQYHVYVCIQMVSCPASLHPDLPDQQSAQGCSAQSLCCSHRIVFNKIQQYSF